MRSGLPPPGRVTLGLVPRQRLGAHLASDRTEVWPERAIRMGIPVPSSASRVSALYLNWCRMAGMVVEQGLA